MGRRDREKTYEGARYFLTPPKSCVSLRRRVYAVKTVAAVAVLMISNAVVSDDGSTVSSSAATQPAPLTGVALIRQEAEAVRPLVKSDLAGQFLKAAERLPSIAPRTLYRDPKTRTYYSKASADKLSPEQRDALVPIELSESVYYTTKYGTPIAFMRPLDLIGQAGVRNVSGKRIMDFGYGTVGQLRLLASLGADVVGVDVDPFLRELYSEPGDQGTVSNPQGSEGRVTLVDGRWPASDDVKKQVGGKFDLIISKNTLKNGYLHPSQPVDERLLIQLGVDDADFVKALYASLKPGGKVMIYNICPAPSPPGKPYKPWADGRCPFSKSLWKSSGFRIVAFDRDDSKAVRQMAKALGWDHGKQAMDLKNDLFAHYTLVERPVDN